MKALGFEKTELSCRNKWSLKLLVQIGLDKRKPREGDRKMSTCNWNPGARKMSYQEKKGRATASEETSAQENAEGVEGEDEEWEGDGRALTEEARAAYVLLKMNREDAGLGNSAHF